MRCAGAAAFSASRFVRVVRVPTARDRFSTQVAAHIQLCDRDFVTPYSTGSYLTTGVETRTSVQCAPAPKFRALCIADINPSISTVSTTSSTIRTTRRFVSRLS